MVPMGRRPTDFPEVGRSEGYPAVAFSAFTRGYEPKKFLALRQEGTVRDYRRMFEVLAAPLTTVPEDVLEGNFINGLKPLIRIEVRLKPRGLDRIMELAQ